MTLDPKRALLVETYPASDRTTIERLIPTISHWHRLAQEKRQYERNERVQAVFEDSIELSNMLYTYMKMPERLSSPYETVYACYDEARHDLQAIALTRRDKGEIHISHLATNPINIRSVVNQGEPSRVEGAGRTIISHICQQVLRGEYLGINLQAWNTSEAFYTKIGFTKLRSLDPFRDGPADMHLTANKIKRLFPQPK